jgi:Lrp/AsnC family transcriptional regulator for asnA, asnC and gidA
MKRMDKLDLAILSILEKDGRRRFTEIAKELDVTEGTIRNRVTRLVENQVVQIVGLINPHGMGYDAPAIIGISIQPLHLEKAAVQISSFKEVTYVVMVSGEFDLIAEVFCKDRQDLADFVKNKLYKVVGVLATKTFFILHTYKMAQGTPVITALIQSEENLDDVKGSD